MQDDTDRFKKNRRTLVTDVVEKLEQLSLSLPEGTMLGAEDSLIAQFGVSRPTLRQAAKVAEAERVIEVRRGVHGGFYAARPDAAHAIRAPARYLRLHNGTLRHMNDVGRLIQPEAAAFAATCGDENLIGLLSDFRSHIGGRDGGDESVAEIIDSETVLASLVGRMSGNPVIELITQIAFAFGGLERDLRFYRSPADRQKTRRLQRSLCDEILAGHVENARNVSAERIALITRWIDSPLPSVAIDTVERVVT